MRPRRRTGPRKGLGLLAVIATMGMLGACAQAESNQRASSGDSSTSEAGVAQAEKDVAAWSQPLTEYPAEPALSQPVDLNGKTVMVVPLGDNIPVLHGMAVGIEEAMKEVGASTKLCDGKFNPTAVAGCLKQAGDEKVDAVMTLFVDYEMAGTAFEALAKQGVPTIIAGVAPSGGRESDDTLAFYDNTPRVADLYDAMSKAALAEAGTETNALWLRLTDSTTTREASDSGVETFKDLCPTCGIATADFTTANLDKLASAVSAALVQNPDTNMVIVPVDSFVPPALQGIRSAGFGNKVKIVSSSSDVAGLQRVKDGQQVADLGTPVVYEGWKVANALMQHLAGDEVRKGDVLVTRNINADNIGEMEISQDAYFTMDWFGNDSFKQMFLEAWGVS